MTNIQEIFDTIAHRYDATNAIISCTYSNVWLKHLAKAVVDHAASLPHPSMLDLCCGTGAATVQLLRTIQKQSCPFPQIVCADFSQKMLAVAQKRLPPSVSFLAADAASLPCANASFDVLYMSFGYRNLTDKRAVLMEIVRILRPGGRLFILELTPPPSRLVSAVHSFLLQHVVPLFGKLITGHIAPYKYLAASIQQFSLPDTLEELKKANLVCTKISSYSFGSCTLLEVVRP